jgi:hypothetical protein
MLKLIYQADPIIQEPPQQEPVIPILRTPFAAIVRLSGPNLYIMQVQDTAHYLNCDLTLEIEESPHKGEPKTVVCHFPEILDEQLNTFIWEDETLYAIVLIQFQMKLMKELLIFCKNHHVSRLVIYPDDAQTEDFGIFQDFLIVEDLKCDEEDDKTKMVIPTTPETYDNWIEFMYEANLRFQQTLWRNQRKNPAIRHYLISHPFGQG